jgi:hypothetical protein
MSAGCNPTGRRVVVDFGAVSLRRLPSDAEVVKNRIDDAMPELLVELANRRATRRASRVPEGSAHSQSSADHAPNPSTPGEDSVPGPDCREPEVVYHVSTHSSGDSAIDATPRLRRYIADPPLIDVSGEPLLPSTTLHALTTRRFWPVILVLGAASGVGLSTAAVGFQPEAIRSALYMAGFLLLLLPLGANTLMYRRAMTALIISSSFEFWYLSLQILIFSTCETLQVLDAGVPMAVAVIPRIFLTGVAMVGLLCIDASRLSRLIKGAIMLTGSLLFAGLGATWRFNSPIGDKEINLGVFRTTVGSLATSSYITLGLFCLKFALQGLVMKRGVVMITFRWKQDRITLNRSTRIPPPLQQQPLPVANNEPTHEEQNL